MTPDGRNRIGSCCGCGIIILFILLAVLLLFYWLVLPPLQWLFGSGSDSNNAAVYDLSAEDSRWLQEEAASGFAGETGIAPDPAEDPCMLPPPPPPPSPPQIPEQPAVSEENVKEY